MGGGRGWMLDTLRGTLRGGSTLAGGGGKLGPGGGVVVDVKSWSKMLFSGTFWKNTTYWSPLDERFRSSFAENCRN